MKRTGYRGSKDPKPLPKFTATRNGKPINPKVGQIADPAALLAQDENFKTVLAWLEDWPEKPPKWEQINENLYKIDIGGTRLSVHSSRVDFSNNPTWGFTILGCWGVMYSIAHFSFSLSETLEAAVKILAWLNNGKQGNAPCAADPVFEQPEEDPETHDDVGEVDILPVIRPRPVPPSPPFRRHNDEFFGTFFPAEEDMEGFYERGEDDDTL